MKITEILKTTRNLYVIRKIGTKEYLTSPKYESFGTFEEAAIYHQEKNAAAVIKDFKTTHTGNERHDKRTKELGSKVEVVKCELTPQE